MDVTLPEHVEALRQEVRKFAEKEIRPHVMAWDEAKTFPFDVVKQLGEMGMMGVIFPEEYGGAGMGYQEYAVVVEELSRVDGSVGITVAAHNSLCSNHIYAMGDERQKQAWLKPLASGKALGAWGLTEPGSGSDAGSLRTSAKKEGSHYILNGTKTFITHGTVGDIFVVMARTRPHEPGRSTADGISAFVLEKGMNGFRAGKQENKLGLRASDTSELIMEDVKVPLENLLEQLPDTYTHADRDLIQRAYRVAEEAHRGQKRLSGEPYINHCLAVAQILAELRVPPDVLAAGLLHDAVEDTNVNGHPAWPEFGSGPYEAVEEFLQANSNFAVDSSREKFLMTFNPRGFLKRLR